jgi:serine phosphatase RsbU (regulator of sigma subunit)
MAEPFLKLTLDYAEEMDSDRFRESAHQNYHLYYEGLGDHEKALSHYQDFIKYRDKVYNLDSKEAALEQEMKFEYETKKISDSIAFAKEKEVNVLMIKQQESELQTQRTLQIALVIILVLILVFALFMFNRFRITHRQKNTIETQKKVVDEKNREISDSINYAKRIQEAILPSRYIFNEVMSNGFVIFKPKDVVSGDFYWIEEAHGMTYIAAADCTGHGVPGALVSVICSNALSKVLLEEGVKDTAEILNRTRDIIIDKFQKSSDRVNDGMDISLCAIDKKNMTLNWAGANNPLWIIRNDGAGNHELNEIKADKQPIGVYEKQKPFTNHVFDIKYNDTLYMFSDGFPDQFGGKDEESRKEGGKKYKSKPFKNFLLNIQDTPIKLQQEKIEKEFHDWMGTLDQIDDVCIIGIRIK